jgi:hypothetical protein
MLHAEGKGASGVPLWPSPLRVCKMSSRLTVSLPPSARIDIPQSDSQASPSGQRQGRDLSMQFGASRSTSISPVDLQSHLYTSLLEARTADVALRVRGTWQAIYRLHRVVLIQAVSPTIAQS